jgi:hypothetical protein
MSTSSLAWAFFIGYLAILALHAAWAMLCLRKNLVSLAIGPIKTKPMIMLGLFVLNLPSIVVFLPSMGFAWIPSNFGQSTASMAHGFYHILLMSDEVFRVGRDPVRGLFLANHFAWAILLFLFALAQ